MSQLKLLTAIALIGGTAAACTYDSRIHDGYTTQYVMAPAPTYSAGFTRHHVVASTYGPSYSTPVMATEGYTPSAYYVTGSPYGYPY